MLQNNTKIGNLPDTSLAHQFVDDIFQFLFIPKTGVSQNQGDLEKGLYALKSHLATFIYDVVNDGAKSQTQADTFFDALPGAYESLQEDAAAFLRNDPTALSISEVLQAYLGFCAIAVYRISHQLRKQGIENISRIFTEHAHSKTGVDIHPGSTIGSHFFIDRGTGVAVGETAVIGNDVKLYQGITIGALNSAKGKKKSKRHPTIENNVIIYSGATIFGGDTIIGRDSIIGGNAWITFGVPATRLCTTKARRAIRTNSLTKIL